ncbi:MAG: PilZ domain-containing protein [Candidatus Omnitrophica bacterium]|nr:PilZ domain-containing protein [Candidatus Omnitrophota bacterium]
MEQEKRSYARVYVGAEVGYRVAGTETRPGRDTILLQDISLSGMRFVANDAWRKDTVVGLTITLPELAVPLSVTAKVVWQKQLSASFFDTGVEFQDMGKDVRGCLTEFIQKNLGRVEERRKSIRCNLSTMLTYTVLDGSNRTGACLTVDVSKSGLKVFCKDELPRSVPLALSFSLPDMDQDIRTEGTVVWARFRDEALWEIGITFQSISDEQVRLISEYVRQTLGLRWE